MYYLFTNLFINFFLYYLFIIMYTFRIFLDKRIYLEESNVSCRAIPL